jgi:hypothetical protein
MQDKKANVPFLSSVAPEPSPVADCCTVYPNEQVMANTEKVRTKWLTKSN